MPLSQRSRSWAEVWLNGKHLDSQSAGDFACRGPRVNEELSRWPKLQSYWALAQVQRSEKRAPDIMCGHRTRARDSRGFEPENAEQNSGKSLC